MGRTLALLVLALVPGLAAAEELVVVVGNDSPVRALTRAQAAQVFLGKPVDLAGLERPVPVDQPEGPVREAFYERLAGRSPSQMKAYWSKLVFTGKGTPPREIDAGLVVKAVARDPRLVGYAARRDLDGSVRAVLVLP